MPNIWTKSAQKLAEAFAGPRTKDVEFDKKVEEVKNLEKGVIEFRNLLKNFQQYTTGFKTFAKDFKTCLSLIYDESEDYSKIKEVAVGFHSHIDSNYLEFINSINNVYLKTSEWVYDFNSVKLLLEKRQEARKEFDHYDEKLEKIYKTREEKLRKGESITAKDVEYYERVSHKYKLQNEKKYKISTDSYIAVCHEAYELMHNVYFDRFKQYNPSIMQVIQEERKFYENIGNVLKKADILESKVIEMDRKLKLPQNTYDPCKYIRGGNIVQAEDNYDAKNEKKAMNSISNQIKLLPSKDFEKDLVRQPIPKQEQPALSQTKASFDDFINFYPQQTQKSQNVPPTNKVQVKNENFNFDISGNNQSPVKARSQPTKAVSQSSAPRQGGIQIMDETLYDFNFNQPNFSIPTSSQFDEFDNHFSTPNNQNYFSNKDLNQQQQSSIKPFTNFGGPNQAYSGSIQKDPFEDIIKENRSSFSGFPNSQKASFTAQQGYSFENQQLNRNTIVGKRQGHQNSDDIFKDFY